MDKATTLNIEKVGKRLRDCSHHAASPAKKPKTESTENDLKVMMKLFTEIRRLKKINTVLNDELNEKKNQIIDLEQKLERAENEKLALLQNPPTPDSLATIESGKFEIKINIFCMENNICFIFHHRKQYNFE